MQITINSDCEVDERCRVDVSNVKCNELKSQIEKTVKNYNPCATKQIEIKLDLILKDDVSVYERPQRLAPKDKDRVNAHIQEWLQQSIMKSNVSEYTSPVVLLKKRDNEM